LSARLQDAPWYEHVWPAARQQKVDKQMRCLLGLPDLKALSMASSQAASSVCKWVPWDARWLNLYTVWERWWSDRRSYGEQVVSLAASLVWWQMMYGIGVFV
jgi:hypothetical protein